MTPSSSIHVGTRSIGSTDLTFFIADIAANHDGDLERAKRLIHLAARAGADAAKFQHFTARTIVSDAGFRALGSQASHQSAWKKSVYEVYDDASLNAAWTTDLKQACDEAGIAFMTSPYSLALIDEVEPHVAAYKVGSGDITWLGIIDHMARKGKPVMVATGASTADEVAAAVATVLAINPDLVLMQCNTNYTGDPQNFAYTQLRVLDTYRAMFPGTILGLSDHTPGLATTLGAVALGARVIEKHFTDDRSRTGPDHGFSMSPSDWRDMVDRTRELEAALGCGLKRVEPNERQTVVLQRRCVRAAADIPAGTVLRPDLLEVLRPCPSDGLAPDRLDDVIGKTMRQALRRGEHVRWTDVG